MGLFEYFILCIVVGVVVYLINAFIPMDANIKRLITIAAIVVLVLIFLNAMGLFGIRDPQIPRLR